MARQPRDIIKLDVLSLRSLMYLEFCPSSAKVSDGIDKCQLKGLTLRWSPAMRVLKACLIDWVAQRSLKSNGLWNFHCWYIIYV